LRDGTILLLGASQLLLGAEGLVGLARVSRVLDQYVKGLVHTGMVNKTLTVDVWELLAIHRLKRSPSLLVVVWRF
jgi:hypothetical protein